MGLRFGKLKVDVPLQEFVELDAGVMLAGELGHGRRARIVKLFRPVGPEPDVGVAAVHFRVEGAVDGKIVEVRALFGDVCVEFRGTFEAREDSPERGELQRSHSLILDKFRRPQRLDFLPLGVGLGDGAGALDIEIQEVSIQRALRQVGAGVKRLAIGDGVERIQGEEGAAGAGEGIDGGQQVGEVAATPVARRSQAVKADGDSRRASFEGFGARRADDEARFGEDFEARIQHPVKTDLVVAEAEFGKRKTPRPVREIGKLWSPEPVMLEVPSFPGDFEFDGARFVRRKAECDEIGVFANDNRRREITGMLRRQALKDRVENVVRRMMRVAPDVDVFKLDTVSGGGAGPEFCRRIQSLIMAGARTA